MTRETDRNSNNIFRIKTNLRDPLIAICDGIDEDEKNIIEDLCDNYFDSLKELNDLMISRIKQEPDIERVWPFKPTDDDTIRITILRWTQQLINKIGRF